MGIPRFFGYIINHFDNIISSLIDVKIDMLYFDFNCLIHPIANSIIEKNLDKYEQVILKEIYKYTKKIISLINPKTVYIAVDGVVPMAKVIQQRKRRYRAVIDASYRNKIKTKHNVPINEEWSSNCISVATKFMETLHKYLLINLKKIDCEIIYSSYHTPNEGEHKIIHHIKQNTYKNVLIYGLDADLILLSMTITNSNVYLLREGNTVNSKDEFIYVNINNFKHAIYEFISERTDLKLNVKRVVNDFIFFCSFLGNDFLPPVLSIAEKGIEKLLETYSHIITICKTYLINAEILKINSVFLIEFINKLNKQCKFHIKRNTRKCFESDSYKRDIWMLDNLKIFDIDVITTDHEKWFRDYYFKDVEMESVCFEYLRGLEFILGYYFNDVPSWQWFYKYDVAPLLSDLLEFIDSYTFNKKFKQSEPITPFIQLLLTIPPKHKYMLPIKYQKIMDDNVDLFPIEYKLDMINKFMFYECEPILPCINLKKVINLTKNIKLDAITKQRNKLLDVIEI